MTLELANDLAQPLALEPLGDHYRLEQGGVVGQGVGLRAHHDSGSRTLIACDRFAPPESTRRGRHHRLARLVHTPPVEPFEQRLKFR
jgi:hypothetical protein